jgi:ElaB/YqjD/DUF883 family membrane-anchored ribosome-binding protein
LVTAYDDVLSQQIKATTSASISVIDNALNDVDSQLASATSQSDALGTQLAASLVTQRAHLLSQRSQALLDESMALSQEQPTSLAFRPEEAANHNFLKMGGLGAVIGLLLGACLAYAAESRRSRAEQTRS